MLYTNFQPILHGVIKHSDWLKLVMWLGTDYNALFQCSMVMPCKNLLDNDSCFGNMLSNGLNQIVCYLN